jgi:hypothetical protein
MKPFTHIIQTFFIGRPYDELILYFGLEENDLKGKEILDRPSAPSSFVAEANPAGILATGSVPMLNRNPDAIEKLAYSDIEHIFSGFSQSGNS